MEQAFAMDGPDQAIRIFIADNNLWVRESLGLLLEQNPNIKVVGKTDTVDGLMDAINQSAPDLLLIAWELSGGVDNRLILDLREKRLGMKIIALSSKQESKIAALRAGADAFVSKADPPDCLLAALDRVIC